MLVLNRRPGESIVIEPDLRITVLSVSDRRVWIGMRSADGLPELRVSASVVSPTEARLEIVPMASVAFDGDRVRIVPASDEDPAAAARAGLAVDRRPGERVEVGEDLWVAVSSVSKGNPTVTFGGDGIGDAFSITLIRPAGSYVRLGVDAPNRRVYRDELWDVVQASAGTLVGTAGTAGTVTTVGAAGEPVLSPVATVPEPGPASLEPAGTPAPVLDPVVHAAVAADMAAGSATR